MASFEGATIDDIYEAFAYAETGSFKDPWIRTIYQPKTRLPDGTIKIVGSTAYGPVQMTAGGQSMIAHQLENLGKTGIKWSDDEVDFMKKMRDQAKLFSKYGGDDMVTGMERYGYGGKGDLISKSDQDLYKSVAKKLLQSELDRVGGIRKLKRSWRGKEDLEYFKKFDMKLKSLLKDRDTSFFFPNNGLMPKDIPV